MGTEVREVLIPIPTRKTHIGLYILSQNLNLNTGRPPIRLIGENYSFWHHDQLFKCFTGSCLWELQDYAYEGCRIMLRRNAGSCLGQLQDHAYEGCRIIRRAIAGSCLGQLQDHAYEDCGIMLRMSAGSCWRGLFGYFAGSRSGGAAGSSSKRCRSARPAATETTRTETYTATRVHL